MRLILPLVALCLFYSPQPALCAEAEPVAQANAGVDYILMPSDMLQIQVFQEPDMDRQVSVSQNYTITLPLIGTIDVRAKTARQVQEQISVLYGRDYLRNPQINVVVVRYAERTVNVFGQVNSPGPVPFPQERGLTLIDAIARAGGFSRLAKKTEVRLTRTLENGTTKTYTINADKLIEGNASSSWLLQPNDLINVPERFL